MKNFNILLPPTEIEIAELNSQLTIDGSNILRKLTFQRDQLIKQLREEKANHNKTSVKFIS